MKRFTFDLSHSGPGNGNGQGFKKPSSFSSTPTFDPTQPHDGALVTASVLRDQFNSLNALIQAIPAGPPGPQGPEGPEGPPGEVTEAQLNTAIWDQTPNNVNGVSNLTPDTASATYNQAQMQAVMNKLNELISALWRV